MPQLAGRFSGDWTSISTLWHNFLAPEIFVKKGNSLNILLDMLKLLNKKPA
jgi:hypothetical protein